jgi:ABC-type glycerol-3-phosphate transport system substrate-binding protein
MKPLRVGLAVGLLLLMAAAAFAGGKQESTGPVTVSFMCTEADLPKNFVDSFNADNPGINLVRVEEDWTKWMVEAMAGTAADLNRLGIGSDTAYYVKRGLFYDMTDLLKNS